MICQVMIPILLAVTAPAISYGNMIMWGDVDFGHPAEPYYEDWNRAEGPARPIEESVSDTADSNSTQATAVSTPQSDSPLNWTEANQHDLSTEPGMNVGSSAEGDLLAAMEKEPKKAENRPEFDDTDNARQVEQKPQFGKLHEAGMRDIEFSVEGQADKGAVIDLLEKMENTNFKLKAKFIVADLEKDKRVDG